jgi:hypothetical protein
MTDFLDFTPDEFIKMTYSERIRLCRLLATRAEEIAARDVTRRTQYAQIAKGWIALANDMERHLTQEIERPAHR